MRLIFFSNITDAMSDAEKLVRCSQLLAALFVYFLEIHPM